MLKACGRPGRKTVHCMLLHALVESHILLHVQSQLAQQGTHGMLWSVEGGVYKSCGVSRGGVPKCCGMLRGICIKVVACWGWQCRVDAA